MLPFVQLITVNLGGDSGPTWRQGTLEVGAKSEMDNCSEKFLLDHGQTREKSPPGAGKEGILHSHPKALNTVHRLGALYPSSASISEEIQ